MNLSLALALVQRLLDFSKLIYRLGRADQDKVKVIVSRAFLALSAHLTPLGLGFLLDRDHEMFEAVGKVSILHDEILKAWTREVRGVFQEEARQMHPGVIVKQQIFIKNKFKNLTD